MRSTAIDRRTFLMLAAAAGAAGRARAASRPDEGRFVAARRQHGAYEIAVVDEAGNDLLTVPLEARGHSFAINRSGSRIVAFARQPGRFAISFAPDGSSPPGTLLAQPGRHFFGHGTFVDRDRLLLATENDYDGERGVLGVYDVAGGLHRLGEIPTGGLDPHEVVMMPDGRTVCIANGGILTHPDFGKLELNLDTMSPSLAYVDIVAGDVVEQVALGRDLHKLAFHHLAVDAFGAVWFGAQYHGPKADRPPLVGRHRRGRAPEVFAGPAEVLRGLDNYIGSVAVDRSGTIVATSSPVGGTVAYWDAATGRSLGATAFRDGCGLASGARERFRMTSGDGLMIEAGPEAGPTTLQGTQDDPIAWDNHLRRLPVTG